VQPSIHTTQKDGHVVLIPPNKTSKLEMERGKEHQPMFAESADIWKDELQTASEYLYIKQLTSISLCRCIRVLPT
jgi:hypothetical protein